MLRAESATSQLDDESPVEQERAHTFSFPDTLLSLLPLFSAVDMALHHTKGKRGKYRLPA